MSFVNSKVGSWFITDISVFLANNIGAFFLIFLFFSYTSYFSRSNHRVYRLFSPVSFAFAAAVCFWIGAHAMNTVNVSLGVPLLSAIAFLINENLFLVFWLFLCLGYLVLAIILATERTIFRPAGAEEKTKPYRSREEGEIRRLYRSGKDRILGGVCGGMAEYLGIDPVIIRLFWVIGTLAWGFGIILYIIFWIVIPRNPGHRWK
jgi:phage shock protein PspC (stress-responsive transcriptional regulator)